MSQSEIVDRKVGAIKQESSQSNHGGGLSAVICANENSCVLREIDADGPKLPKIAYLDVLNVHVSLGVTPLLTETLVFIGKQLATIPDPTHRGTVKAD